MVHWTLNKKFKWRERDAAVKEKRETEKGEYLEKRIEK
jgi:hypothetical protein